AGNFPDKIFRTYISSTFDVDSDGVLSSTEIASADSMYIGSKGITDLTGIKHFTSLRYLYCSNNGLINLDLSGCTNLRALLCSLNSLTNLNVTGCTRLERIYGWANSLESLNVSTCTALTRLSCSMNRLPELDVSSNRALMYLDCARNNLSVLNLRNNAAIKELDCASNGISALDLSSNLALKELKCSNNFLRALDLSLHTALTDAVVSVQNISGLNSHARGDGTYYVDLVNDCGLSSANLSRIISSSVKGYNTKSANVLTDYDTASGVASFSEEPVRFCYDYDTGSEHVMSVAFNAFPKITMTELVSGYANRKYDCSLEASGTGSLRWSIDDEAKLPDGLNFYGTLGKISGTPKAEGKYTFTLTVSNTLGSDSKTFTLEILSPSSSPESPIITTTNADIPTGYVNTSYSFYLSASLKSGITWSIDEGEVPGLTLSSSGRLAGRPSQSGSFDITVSVTDRYGGTDSQKFTVSVLPSSEIEGGPVILTTQAELPAAYERTKYSFKFTASGQYSSSWSIVSGDIPGLGLSSAGSLTGTPERTGEFPFTVQAMMRQTGGTDTKSFVLTVKAVAETPETPAPSNPVTPEQSGGDSGGGGCDASAEGMLAAAVCLPGLLVKRRKRLAVMLVVCLAVIENSAWADVAINATNFPDEIFKNYVSSNFDTNNDGTLSDAEIANITSIYMGSLGITSLKGIEYFTALRTLNFGGNQLATLDVSHNTALTYQVRDNNQLTTLDVSRNTALRRLNSSPQGKKGLIISNTGDSSYPYQLEFSNYMNSSQFSNVSGVQGRDSISSNIATTYAGGIARFASLPASVKYSYNTGYAGSGGTMDVTISGNTSDTPTTPTTPDTPAPNTPTTPTTPESSPLSSHKYTVFDLPMTWTEAKAYCESLGGHLATITSQEEFDIVVSLLSADEDRPYWLGASDAEQEGSWKWVTSEDFTFTKWHTGEPNNQGGEEHYLILAKDSDNSWGWNDATNSHNGIDPSMWSFICEWEPVEADFAPMNSEYLRYLEDPEAYFDGSEFYGDTPDPLDLSHLADNPPRGTVTPASAFKASSKHDPRTSGTLPQVRNQTPYGTCWSFASLGALETSYIAQGFGSTAPDTSELHQAWFVYKDTREGYSYPLDDKKKPTLEQGGNSSQSIAFLSRAGTASENDMPYSQAASIENNPPSRHPEDYPNAIRLKEAYNIGAVNANTREEIKRLIQQYGAVTFAYEHKK
ncbi:MAG: putative Ig domain-containing protein, partial [Synergistaceae bacterium]|nr:putative Ig domain-containing protein [Synergistaceae bacterium]